MRKRNFDVLYTMLLAVLLGLQVGEVLGKEALLISWNDGELDRDSPMPSSLAKVAEKATRSVVTLSVTRKVERFGINEEKKTLFLDPKMEEIPSQHSFGSGIILSKSGVILTNAHVVEGALTCHVILNPGVEKIEARIIATDKESDLALVKIENANGLTPAVFTRDPPKVGDFVLALGNPHGVGKSLTKGIFSARDRSRGRNNSHRFGRYLQVDAPVHPGNSGGALMDIQGRVIGVNTAYLPEATGSIGFAIPSEEAVKVALDLWNHGHVKYSYLGVRMVDLDRLRRKELKLPADLKGVVILSVEMDLAAAKAGLMPGDIFCGVNSRAVSNVFEAGQVLRHIGVNEVVDIEIFRKGEKKTLKATLTERPQKPKPVKEKSK